LSCIGGVQALFPILDTVVQSDLVNPPLTGPLLSPDSDKPEVDGWEVLPSSSYAGNKFEKLFCIPDFHALAKKMSFYVPFRLET
jgi:hypothetical protein